MTDMFEFPVIEYPGEAGLEYVAAAYEEKGAEEDSYREPANSDELFFYWDHAAYGQAYWAYEKFKQEAYK